MSLDDTRLEFEWEVIDNCLKRNLDSLDRSRVAAILPESGGRGGSGNDWPVGRREGVGVRLRGGLSRSGDRGFGIFNRLISRPPFKNLQKAKHLVKKGQVSCQSKSFGQKEFENWKDRNAA